ncbi:hypothetical protein D9M69_612090 [compost metagenome]
MRPPAIGVDRPREPVVVGAAPVVEVVEELDFSVSAARRVVLNAAITASARIFFIRQFPCRSGPSE